MWRGGMEMVKARPLTGVGDMGLEEVSKEYYVSDDSLYFGHMHNNFVHMAVIWGVRDTPRANSSLIDGPARLP